jgi:hypothetical protein
MAQKAAFPENLSTSALSSLLGITPARLGQLVAAGIIEKAGHGLYPAPAVAAYCSFLRSGGTEDTDDDDSALDLRKERAALVNIQRRIAERELSRLEERFVDVDTVGAHLAAELTSIKHRIRGLPSVVAPRLCLMSSPAEIAVYVREEIDIILTDLSETGAEIIKTTIKDTRTNE